MSSARMKLGMMLGLLPLAAGCTFNGSGTPQVLGPQAFYETRPIPGPEDRRQSMDRGGAIVHNPPPVQPQSPIPPPQVTRIAPSVNNAVAAAAAEGSSVPIPGMPTTIPSGTTAQYLTAGGVVVTVSDKPIYADKVIRALTPVLQPAAKELDIRAYRTKAQTEIVKQVGTMVRDELLYATAVQNLSSTDKRLADGLTAEWRKRQITEAGGSEEQARAKARLEGIEFDDKVNDQHRVMMWRVYLQKKVIPLVQVTPDDIRRYYDQHINEFTEHEQVQFRLIKITAEATGGRERAIDKIGGIRQRMLNATAEEFAKEATDVNDDRALKQSGGRIGSNDGWLQRGSFAVKDVEDAVWNLQTGQVSDVIEVNNSFYIARLENRKVGRVRAFDDEQVQTNIRELLRKPQIEARQRQLEQRLIKEAVIFPEQPVLEPVVEMAMQKYAEWRAAP